MAHPYHHALASVKKWGGEVSDYMPLHTWFDQSKSIAADFRHRALRHHAEGIFIAGYIDRQARLDVRLDGEAPYMGSSAGLRLSFLRRRYGERQRLGTRTGQGRRREAGARQREP